MNAVLPGPTASEGVTDFVNTLAAGAKQTPAEFEKEFFHTVRPTSLLHGSRRWMKWRAPRTQGIRASRRGSNSGKGGDVQMGRRREREGSIVAKIGQFYPVNFQRFSLP